MKNRLKTGQIVELNNTEDIKSDKHKVRIEEVVSNEEIIIEVPIVGGNALTMHSGAEFEITYYKEASMFVQKVKVITRFMSGPVVCARLSLVGKSKRFNRRQYFRMPVLLDGFTKHGDDNYKSMTTTNLSAGGIRFVSLEKFQAGDKINIKFMIKEIELELEGTVISCGLMQDSIRRYDVRVKFEEVDSRSERIIMSYLFEQQRAIKRKGLA